MSEIPAFHCPLSEHGLEELGRLAVNFGHLEFLLDWVLRSRAGMKSPRLERALISGLSISRKLDIIEQTHSLSQKPAATELVKEASKVIRNANAARNDLLHGYWAYEEQDDLTFKARSRTPKKTDDKALDSEEIGKIADEAAVAAKLLMRALWKANDIPESKFPVMFFSGKEPTAWSEIARR